jgi:Protein of unknown function (DUF2892)
MITNVGVIDQALRLIAGFGLLGWASHYYGPPLPGWAGWLVAIVGAYPAITGLLRYCPVFAYARMSTCADDV